MLFLKQFFVILSQIRQTDNMRIRILECYFFTKVSGQTAPILQCGSGNLNGEYQEENYSKWE